MNGTAVFLLSARFPLESTVFHTPPPLFSSWRLHASFSLLPLFVRLLSSWVSLLIPSLLFLSTSSRLVLALHPANIDPPNCFSRLPASLRRLAPCHDKPTPFLGAVNTHEVGSRHWQTALGVKRQSLPRRNKCQVSRGAETLRGARRVMTPTAGGSAASLVWEGRSEIQV